MNLAAFASSSLSPARSNNSANNNLTSCDETTNSTSVGYLILSSLGDPLLETWKFAPSHHGTRPDPNLIGRMVISSLTVGNNNNNNSKKNGSVPKSTTLCISLNNYKNEDDDENENHQDDDDDYKNREHFLHIFALEFSVGGNGDEENSNSSNNNFVSVVMRIISKSTSSSSGDENEEGGFDLQHYFLSSRSWSDLCALSIWFTSILSIDWLLPLAENIESIAQTQHKEENFTTQQVLNNTNSNSKNDTDKKSDDDNNVIFNKVIRMFHSSSSIQERNMNPALVAALNFEVSSATSPSPRKDGSQNAPLPPQQVSPSASLMTPTKSPSAASPSSSNSQKLKYNNSLSVCHEMFLVALRICLIKNYEKNIANENNQEQQQTDEEKQAQKELQTNSKAVTMEADVILDDLQQQILNRPSFIDSHFYRQGGAKENVIGVALVPQQQGKESDDKNSKKYQPLWILQPRRLQTLTAAVDDDDEDIIDDKTWKHTICSRLLKLLEKKTAKTKKTDDEDSNTNKSTPISNVAFRFFGERIEVLMNEISIDQDDEEEAYFHSLSFGDDEKKMKTKWRTFSVILEC